MAYGVRREEAVRVFDDPQVFQQRKQNIAQLFEKQPHTRVQTTANVIAPIKSGNPVVVRARRPLPIPPIAQPKVETEHGLKSILKQVMNYLFHSPKENSDYSKAEILTTLIQQNTDLLKTEWVFRISGNKKTVTALVEYLKHHSNLQWSKDVVKFKYQGKSYAADIHDVIGAYKQIYREKLNIFASSDELTQKFRKTALQLTERNATQKLRMLLKELSAEQKKSLKDFIQILLTTQSFSAENRMYEGGLLTSSMTSLFSTDKINDLELTFKVVSSLLKHPEIL